MSSYRFALAKFRPSRVIFDARRLVSESAALADRRYRAERYAARNHTCGKRATYRLDWAGMVRDARALWLAADARCEADRSVDNLFFALQAGELDDAMRSAASAVQS